MAAPPSAPAGADADPREPKSIRLTRLPTYTVVVRFADAAPDLRVETEPSWPVARLKQAVRASDRLGAQHGRRLRLICSGRLLQDGARVREAVFGGRRTAAPPPKGKAKAGAQADLQDDSDSDDIDGSVVYVHCAIAAADAELDAAALEREAALAAGTGWAGGGDDAGHSKTTLDAPVGFDRLLGPGSADADTGGDDTTPGFTRADVAGLRAQFVEIVAARHTPETMPSAAELLQLEDAWLDGEGAGGRGAGAAAGLPGPDSLAGADDDTARTHDTLIGVASGFFWPLGALVWGLREQGVWSQRRGLAVLAGVGVNIGFGLVRVLS